MQDAHTNAAEIPEAIETALDACYEAEAAAKMLIEHVAHLAGENAVQRAAAHLQSANHITPADEDAPPEPHLINRIAHRINSVSDALAEVICGSMDNTTNPPETQPPEVLDLEQASRHLRIHAGSLRRIASEGRIPARKVGREWRFSRLALQAWLACSEGTALASKATGSAPSLAAESAGFVLAAIGQPRRQ